MGQAPHPTSELVPLPELASALGESLGLPKHAGFLWDFGYCTLVSSGAERIKPLLSQLLHLLLYVLSTAIASGIRVRSVILVQAGA